jgi:hypothetical protein
MKNRMSFGRSFSIFNAALFAAALILAVPGQSGAQPFGARQPTSANEPGPVDPATGLPVGEPNAGWKDPQWKDPEKVLKEVTYEGLPISEVARNLREQFDSAFDFVIPATWHAPAVAQIAPEFSDPSSIPIRIQLKNVKVSEVFNALNLAFESENTPLQWQLKMNGSRPTVVLRVLPNAETLYRGAVKPMVKRIYFVGEMVGDEKAGGMSLEQLVKTISEVYEMSYGTSQGPISNHLQFHKQAQLLIVSGTVDEVNYVSEILAALRQKESTSRRQQFGGGGGGFGGGGGTRPQTSETTEKPKAP